MAICPFTPRGFFIAVNQIGWTIPTRQNILGNIQAGGAAGGQPLGIGEVLSAENAASSVDAAMEVALNEHLPQGGSIAESAAETLSTPQMAQVRH